MVCLREPIQVLPFESAADFRRWLRKSHAVSAGVWLRFFKKASGVKSVNYAEALDQALCHGWIDGQVKSFDQQSWIQKFTPRRPKSVWSKINTQHVERLIKAELMTAAGLAAIEAAKADGRWQAAYDSPRNAMPPADFLKQLDANPKAKAFFQTLNRANVYSIVYRLQTARKPATRQKRMQIMLDMLAQGRTFHPQSKLKKNAG